MSQEKPLKKQKKHLMKEESPSQMTAEEAFARAMAIKLRPKPKEAKMPKLLVVDPPDEVEIFQGKENSLPPSNRQPELTQRDEPLLPNLFPASETKAD